MPNDDDKPTVVRLFAILCLLLTLFSGIGVVVTPITWLLGLTPGSFAILSLFGGIVGTWCLTRL